MCLTTTLLAYRDVELLVWFRSLSGSIIFAAPAVPDLSSGPGELAVNFQVSDAGAYDMTLVASERRVLAAGAHGTKAQILPLAAGPWRLWVGGGGAGSPPASLFHLPQSTCPSLDQQEGRWIKCKDAGIRRQNCLRDGWVFVPHGCLYTVLSPPKILQGAESARKKSGKPLWIAFLSSSIGRGTFHSLLDVISGVQYDSAQPGTVVREELFNIHNPKKDVPGEGSSLKCWGWFDAIIGELRVSFSDFRMVYTGEQSYGPQLLKRMGEIIVEGPSMIVIEVEGNIPGFVESILSALKAAPDYNGIVVLAPVKQRFLSGGIKASFSQYPPGSAAFRPTPTVVKELVAAQLEKCGQACSRISPTLLGSESRPRLVVGDELLMAWAFVFDMERPMASTSASQHYHYYQHKVSGKCAADGRVLFGAVAEMAAHMYLGTLLRSVGAVTAGDADEPPVCSEPAAPAHFFRTLVCADCPQYLGTKRKGFPFYPPKSSPMSLSNFGPRNRTTAIKALRDLDLQGCYHSPHHGALRGNSEAGQGAGNFASSR